jgi:hypothetical protein
LVVIQNALVGLSDIGERVVAKYGDLSLASEAQTFLDEGWVIIPRYTVVPTWAYRIAPRNKAEGDVPSPHTSPTPYSGFQMHY